jgi:hypothetical protein
VLGWVLVSVVLSEASVGLSMERTAAVKGAASSAKHAKMA